jgi:hypothetical protein
MFACYASEADIAWFPTGESDDVLSERVPGVLDECGRGQSPRATGAGHGTARPRLREVA